MKKRIVSLLMALALCLSLLPTSALAETAEEPVEQEQLEQVEPTEPAQQDEEQSAPEETTEETKPMPAMQMAPVPLAAANAAHTDHPICGKTCGHKSGDTSEHDSVTWEGVDKLDSTTITEGTAEKPNYYLTKTVTLSDTWYVPDNVVLCLNGQTITCKTANTAITVNSNSSFTLTDCQSGGKITHGTDSDGIKIKGRGVQVNSGSTFNMYGGSISGNTGENSGGVDVNGGSFQMYDGSITGNEVNDSNGVGGGVYVESGTFTMSGGTIGGTGNDANTATLSGGGVFVGGGTFEMSGGSITGNTASSGGGVLVTSSGTFKVSGSVNITGNKKDGAASNVYLSYASPNNAIITIAGKLTEGAKIGVTLGNSHSEVFTSGWSSKMTDNAGNVITPAGYFTHDGGTYSAAPENGEVVLKAKEAATFTAPTAKPDLVYNGNSQALVNEGSATGGTMKYSLTKDGTYTEAIPTGKDATTYTVWYKVVGDDDHSDTEAKSVTVEIAPKTLTKDDLTYTGSITKVYDGKDKHTENITLSVKGVSGLNFIVTKDNITYNSANVYGATKATLTLPDISNQTNYKFADGFTSIDVAAKITPRPIMVKSVTATDRDYEKGNKAVDVSATFRDTSNNEVSLIKDADYTATGTMNTDTATGDSGENNNAQVSVKLRNPNYSMADYTGTTPVKIWKLAAPTVSVAPIPQKWSDTAAKEITPQWQGIPEDAGNTTFSIIDRTFPDGISMGDGWSMDTATGTLRYTLTGATKAHAGQKIELKVHVSMANYQETDVVLTINILARSNQPDFKFAETTKTVTYGDADFTVTAAGQKGGSTVTYASSNTAVATVDSTTGKVHIVGAGTATITATAGETPDYNEATASYTLTVNKRTIKVKADDKSMTVNGKLPEFTVSYDNLGSATAADIFNTPPIAFTTADGKTVGTFEITVAVSEFNGNNYEVETVPGTLTVTKQSSGGYYYKHPTASGTTATKKSPGTGDAGLLVYGLTALTSYTGTALVLRRRKRED